MPRAREKPVAVLTHGSGSTGDFLRRAFGPALQGSGWRLEPVEDRSGSASVVAAALDAAVAATGATLVGGVSLGAHAAALWASGRPSSPPHGLLLVLPAWTGAPDEVAAASATTAKRVAELGVSAALIELRDGSWVAEELARAWPRYGTALPAVLRATARSPGPSVEQLRRVTAPTGIVALRDDPFHPVEVARSWARLIPRAALVELDASAPAEDVSVLGEAALAALALARVEPGPGQTSKR